MTLGISVIICCYNSAARLPHTLKHLAAQIIPDNFLCEVILIDNASTDNTLAVAQYEWARYECPNIAFRSFTENQPGKNYAFQIAVKVSKYDYILTCDDDNWLLPNYIALAFNIINSAPSMAALGGTGLFEPEEPLNPQMAPYISDYVNGPQTWVASNPWVYGAGSVYRKSVYTDLLKRGWQHITTGRKGSSLICGEDVEICYMMYLTGFKIAFDDRLVFKHFVPLKKQNLEFIIRLRYWLSYSHVLLASYTFIIDKEQQPIKQKINKWLINSLKALIVITVSIIKTKLNSSKALTPYQRLAFQSYLGSVTSLIFNRKRIINHHHHLEHILNKA